MAVDDSTAILLLFGHTIKLFLSKKKSSFVG